MVGILDGLGGARLLLDVGRHDWGEGADGGVREIRGKGGNPPKGCLCGGAQMSRERDDGSNVVVGGGEGDERRREPAPGPYIPSPLVRQIKRRKQPQTRQPSIATIWSKLHGASTAPFGHESAPNLPRYGNPRSSEISAVISPAASLSALYHRSATG